ncbi:hypothetical protein Q4S45_18375 [Massilia sp. R2A-15]|uniref:hypothetical protein n=1 Tax=Massilia sp. R2A-15 TaxID=3064278 RepID=UPI002735F14B|nr:hypothetical protein [Massilia sp. R2A-15]WLI88664.1 hypothetical protein Q4S45_18375 [Massilia sp. R2A-15]
MNGQFNAIDYAQQLEAAGVPQAQAEVHAKMLALALVSCSASRADLAALGEKLNCRIDSVKQELTNHIDSVKQELTNHIDLVEQKLSNRIESVRMELSARIDSLEQEIRHLRKQLYWMFGIHTALIIAVLVKQFFP